MGQPGSLFDQSAQLFAKRANERLGDGGKVTVYGSSQLGSDSELMKKLKLGTVTLALPSTVMSTAVAQFGLFEMPYLVRDREHMKKIRDEIVLPEFVPPTGPAPATPSAGAGWQSGADLGHQHDRRQEGDAALGLVRDLTPKARPRPRLVPHV